MSKLQIKGYINTFEILFMSISDAIQKKIADNYYFLSFM